VRGIAVIGNLARDVIDGGAPRVGGAPYHAARGLRLLGPGTHLVARCAPADRQALVPPVAALGVPLKWLPSARTTSFELRYSGEEREMVITDPGTPWTIDDVLLVGRATGRPSSVPAGPGHSSSTPTSTRSSFAT
jgi:hypothetical protein